MQKRKYKRNSTVLAYTFFCVCVCLSLSYKTSACVFRKCSLAVCGFYTKCNVFSFFFASALAIHWCWVLVETHAHTESDSHACALVLVGVWREVWWWVNAGRVQGPSTTRIMAPLHVSVDFTCTHTALAFVFHPAEAPKPLTCHTPVTVQLIKMIQVNPHRHVYA